MYRKFIEVTFKNNGGRMLCPVDFVEAVSEDILRGGCLVSIKSPSGREQYILVKESFEEIKKQLE